MEDTFKPETFGPRHHFERLAILLRGDKKNWRKVARMISNANRLRPRFSEYGFDYVYEKQKRISRSLSNTVLPEYIKDEIRNIYKIHNDTDGWWERMKMYGKKWI